MNESGGVGAGCNRSTQKLPSSMVFIRTKPRTEAIATAMPTAAETKFCTAKPAIWTR